MESIQPLPLNMDYSRALLEANPQSSLLSLIQKIAIYSIAPFTLIVFAEALLKNVLLLNTINTGIALFNKIHALFASKWEWGSEG